jgi:hypothetical protein
LIAKADSKPLFEGNYTGPHFHSIEFKGNQPGSPFIEWTRGTNMTRPTIHGLKSGPAESTEARDAYSIEEFCHRHGISHGTYYNLKALGLGPREGGAMTRVLISRESAASWRKKIETSRSAGKALRSK